MLCFFLNKKTQKFFVFVWDHEHFEDTLSGKNPKLNYGENTQKYTTTNCFLVPKDDRCAILRRGGYRIPQRGGDQPRHKVQHDLAEDGPLG